MGKRRRWFGTVLLGGFALPKIWTRTLMVTAISVVVTIINQRYVHVSLTPTPFVLLGLPLGIFLGFRNNTAYDRFWEARKLWGALVNTTRSLARQVLTLIEPQAGVTATPQEVLDLERKIFHVLVAHVHALRHRLRDTDPMDLMARTLPPDEVKRLEGEDNVPLALLHRLGELFMEARRKKWIDAYHVPIVEQSLIGLTDIQGACERIKSTPIPYSYTVLMHRIVAGYCTLLPFGLAETIGWATPVVVLGISYTFFGLDAIGDEIEQPFGFDTNDLPIKAIARNIEIELRKRIGDENIPEPIRPKKGVLC